MVSKDEAHSIANHLLNLLNLPGWYVELTGDGLLRWTFKLISKDGLLQLGYDAVSNKCHCQVVTEHWNIPKFSTPRDAVMHTAKDCLARAQDLVARLQEVEKALKLTEPAVIGPPSLKTNTKAKKSIVSKGKNDDQPT
jgi:hypothetical protein